MLYIKSDSRQTNIRERTWTNSFPLYRKKNIDVYFRAHDFKPDPNWTKNTNK